MKKIKNFTDYKSIPTTYSTFEKKGSRWVKTGQEKYLLTEKEYNRGNSEEWTRFLTNIGSFEKRYKEPTYRGYKTVRRLSISPDKTSKVVVDFDLSNSKAYANAYKKYSSQFDRRK